MTGYKDFSLVNTKSMFSRALKRGYAIPAFNFYNMESLKAILNSAHQTKSPVILAVSESGLEYMGSNLLMGMICGSNFKPGNVVLHLDHGTSLDACMRAIDMGFSSVMIDASDLPFSENMALTKQVVDYAHKFDVSVEAELGTLSGFEDENISSGKNIYTNPNDVINFVKETDIDSLAIAIGTSHGAYKRKNDTEELRFDILEDIAKKLPEFPLVLHGASSIPQDLVSIINDFGGTLSDARGIPMDQIKRAVSMNICKINVDSDSRLAFTAAVRESLSGQPANFNPREYLSAAIKKMTETYIWEINNIMNSASQAA